LNWSHEHGMSVRRFGAGPELVWIHGLGESSTCFEDVAPRIAGYTHVLIDLPGYGRSPWPEHALGLPELADHVVRWLGERAAATLIGHSMGGVLATLIAERAPVRAIVNIDGNISPGDCTFSGKAMQFSREEFRTRGIDLMKRDVLAEPGAPGTYYAALCFAFPDMFHRQAQDLVALSATCELASRLAALKIPALFVAGVPHGICAESRELLTAAGARWIGIEPAAHWVYLDQPARFADEVARFLASV
jgi:pimeloyl-ACP methyl ester carboxylesterase